MSIPVVISTNGYGIPVKQVASGAPVMTIAANGLGLPIILSNSGLPFVVVGAASVAPSLFGGAITQSGADLIITPPTASGSPNPTVTLVSVFRDATDITASLVGLTIPSFATGAYTVNFSASNGVLPVATRALTGSFTAAAPWSATSVVGFGDSIVYGQGASSADKQWIDIFSVSMSAGTPLNQGIAGTVLQNSNDSGGSPRANNGRNRFAAALLGGNAREMAVVAYGYNDARYIAAPATFNVTEYAADLREVLNGLRAGGYAANRILVVAPYYITDTGLSTGSAGFSGQSRAGFETFVAAAQSAAQDFGTYFYDAYAYMRDNGGASLISGDSIHPNDMGHQAIAGGAYSSSAIINATASPASVAVTSIANNTASVAFGVVSGAVSYEVQIGVDGTHAYTVNGAGEVSPISMTGVAAGVYRARARAVMGGGVYGAWGFSPSTATVADAVPAGPFLSDSFTEAITDTNITSHTPEVGSTWVRHGAGGTSMLRTTALGRIYSTGITSVFVNPSAPTSENYYVEVVVNAVSLFSGDVVGIAGRMDPSINTMYLARYTKSVNQWQLLKLVAGVATTLGTSAQTLTVGTDYTLRLLMVGTSIKVLVDGVEIISVTDTDISAAGRAGIRNSGSAQSSSTGIQISSMIAETV